MGSVAAGHGGQVVLSRSTRELLDDSFDLCDLGEHRLKDLSRPQRLYQLGAGTFPPPKTVDRLGSHLGRDPLIRKAIPADSATEELDLHAHRFLHAAWRLTKSAGSVSRLELSEHLRRLDVGVTARLFFAVLVAVGISPPVETVAERAGVFPRSPGS